MQLVLVLPGLLALRDADTPPVRAPALAHLLATAGVPVRHEGGLDAALASRYGVLRQSDWPLAPIRLAALGVDPRDAFWLAADPVTLVVGRDDVQLAAVVDDLARADAEALIATLNAHFAADGLAFVAPRPDAIFVGVATRPRLSTHPLASTSGRSLRTLLPEGPDRGAWRRWQSEIQMLLHEHPVNVERERIGRPPANSLWFSHGGTMPARSAPGPSMRTFANDGVAAALAAHAASPARAVPARLDDALADAEGAESIVVALPPPLDWASVERSWAAPARKALAAGRLATVTLIADDAGEAVVWHASRPGFWKRIAGRLARRNLAAFLAAARRND
jgi:hypothetical protein